MALLSRFGLRLIVALLRLIGVVFLVWTWVYCSSIAQVAAPVREVPPERAEAAVWRHKAEPGQAEARDGPCSPQLYHAGRHLGPFL